MLDALWRRLVTLEYVQHYREYGHAHPLSMRRALLGVSSTLWREERHSLWAQLHRPYLLK